MTDDLQRRVADLLHHAVASLDPTDRDERIAYCQQNNQHGVRMHPPRTTTSSNSPGAAAPW